jgi:hypothetical protein
MTDKEIVLSVYPDAVCSIHTSTQSPKYRVKDHGKILGTSFISEECAWAWSKAILNREIMDRLEQ